MATKKTYYTLDIKNPYCSKEKLLWKHNSDESLGKIMTQKEVRRQRREAERQAGKDFYKMVKEDKEEED